NGLGRSHALALAARGAKIVVNDLGGAADGSGASSTAAELVVDEIRSAGGEAIANGANVCKFEEVEALVAEALETWGRIDVLINNAGILRDKSFAKMDLPDFKLVSDVHYLGTVNCTKAVWNTMREREYGRIVMTTSSSGMYGNFGQSNYGAAKMAVLGLMKTLLIEGEKSNIRINALGPGAATRMTEELLQEDIKQLMTVEPVSQGMVVLCQEDSPNGVILNAQAGSYSVTELVESHGLWLPPGQQNAESIAASWDQIADQSAGKAMKSGAEHVIKMVTMAAQGMSHNI
ncbi:MAG: 3-oxoacyl-ACP reductase, partial [Halieaceae bacterium]|nr:3-oxoacyl-ACP reductase [Halieaceae bacterium]